MIMWFSQNWSSNISQTALEVVSRASSSSEVLSLNLTNLVILLALKVLLIRMLTMMTSMMMTMTMMMMTRPKVVVWSRTALAISLLSLLNLGRTVKQFWFASSPLSSSTFAPSSWIMMKGPNWELRQNKGSKKQNFEKIWVNLSWDLVWSNFLPFLLAHPPLAYVSDHSHKLQSNSSHVVVIILKGGDGGFTFYEIRRPHGWLWWLRRGTTRSKLQQSAIFARPSVHGLILSGKSLERRS